MGLTCPQCLEDSLKILSRIELPPDNRSDEIAVQIVVCSKCGFQGIAVYEESRRGSFDNESFIHRGYFVEPDLVRKVQEIIDSCPNPNNRRCTCKSHRYFNKIGENGDWNWPELLDNYQVFEIQYTKR